MSGGTFGLGLLAQGVVSLVGIAAGSYGAYSAGMDIAQNNITPCNALDLTASTVTLAASSFTLQRAVMGLQAIAAARQAAQSSVVTQPGSYAPIEKFTRFIFAEGDPSGKAHVFRSLGYGPGDSELLVQIYEEQAWSKYQQGQYTYGVLNEHGQRITIEIVLDGIGEATGKRSYIATGWMIRDNGARITLNTPMAGFTR